MEGLRQGRLSAALTYDLDLPLEVAFERLVSLPPYVLLPAAHPLASRDHLTLSDLKDEPYVMLDLPQSREYFLGLFLQEDITPRVAARSAHADVVRALVASGHGFGLANVRPCNRAALDGRPLAYVPLESRYRPMVLGIATIRAPRVPRVVSAFEAFCLDALHLLVQVALCEAVLNEAAVAAKGTSLDGGRIAASLLFLIRLLSTLLLHIQHVLDVGVHVPLNVGLRKILRRDLTRLEAGNALRRLHGVGDARRGLTGGIPHLGERGLRVGGELGQTLTAILLVRQGRGRLGAGQEPVDVRLDVLRQVAGRSGCGAVVALSH
jgi:hypothetical protein